MNKPLGYYLTGSAADRLADEYGDRLEDMTKDQKLLTINVLSGVLHQLEANPCEEYTIAEYLDSLPLEIRQGISHALCSTLIELDECESSWIETLVMVLAIAITEETSQHRQQQAVR